MKNNFTDIDFNDTKSINQTSSVRVGNTTGSTIAKGSVVYISGLYGTGSTAIPAVSKAKSDKPETCLTVLGVLSEDIANNAVGNCVTKGLVSGFDLSGPSSGSELYISDTTAGILTSALNAGALKIRVGILLTYSDTDARVFVDIKNNSNSIKNNYTATSAPSSGDDNLDGYEIGSEWYATISGITTKYVCLSASTSNAVWSLVVTPYTMVAASEKTGLVDDDILAILDSEASYSFKKAKFANFQSKLISGTNIKTVNGNSLLGFGNVSISSSVNWGGIGGTLSDQTDLQSALDAKQASLGYTPENVSNKATDFLTVNDTLYPSVEAVKEQLDLKANLASPALTGNPTAPTQSFGDDSTKIATTAFVKKEILDLICPIGVVFDWKSDLACPIPNIIEVTEAETTLSRTTYATLWSVVSGKAVSYANWTANKDYGLFHKGDGSTTFGIPKNDGYTYVGKVSTRTMGRYEQDSIASHTHSVGATFAFGYAWSVVGGSAGFLQAGSTDTSATGGSKTKMENLPMKLYIRYA